MQKFGAADLLLHSCFFKRYYNVKQKGLQDAGCYQKISGKAASGKARKAFSIKSKKDQKRPKKTHKKAAKKGIDSAYLIWYDKISLEKYTEGKENTWKARGDKYD